jgi:hypothetical protein
MRPWCQESGVRGEVSHESQSQMERRRPRRHFSRWPGSSHSRTFHSSTRDAGSHPLRASPAGGTVERGKSKMAAIGALMRKLLLIARAVIRSGRAFDPATVNEKTT